MGIITRMLTRKNTVSDKERQEKFDTEINVARGRLRDAVQNIESGNRVLENMAGMMAIMKPGHHQ